MSSCCFVKLFRSGSIISSVEFARDRDRDRDDVDARSPPSGFDNDRRKLLDRSNALLLASSDSIVSSDLRCVLSSNNDLMEE